MFQSIIEQKMALVTYYTENSAAIHLTVSIGQKLVNILNSIEEITASVFARLASISIVIPYIHVLIRTYEKINDEDSGVYTMKALILHSLRSPLQDKERKDLTLAIFLDVRFKDKFFVGNIIKATLKEQVLEGMTMLLLLK